MKLSINWLNDYINPQLSTGDLIHRLTMAGLEVEEEHILAKDTVLDLEITPNRPDCLNTIGLAREISAITAKKLTLPKIKTYAAKRSTTHKLSISIENPSDCGTYVATLLKGATIANAPEGVQDRLRSMAINPINNAVDITNFVLMEMGQPLHVFDYDKIVGGAVIVRRARSGETITTLDGIERKLDPSILVIADAQKPIAIAGIMGGLESAVSATTTNILLESAQFDMGLIRRASRALGLKSDSSYRFERGVDEQGVITAANRATDLLLALTGANVDARHQAGRTAVAEKRTISLTVADIEGLLGTKVSAAQVKAALLRLGMKVTVLKGRFKIVPPAFRRDIKQPVDIIEEIARIIGYDNLDVSMPTIQVANIITDNRPRQIKAVASDILLKQGYNEVITYSLINQKDLDKSGLNQLPVVPLTNALSGQYNILRPSMLPSLLTVASTNINRGQKELKIFEIGKRYFKEGERPTIGILLSAKRGHDWRRNTKETADFYDLKGVVEQIMTALDAPVTIEAATHPSMDPNACAKLVFNGEKIGTIGRVSAGVLSNWDIKNKEIYFAGIHIDDLYKLPKTIVKYKPVAEFPASVRDISIAVTTDVSYARIRALCLKHGGEILNDVQLVEEYRGEKIQEGSRGLVLSLVYQSAVRTLREEEVAAAHQRITDALIGEFDAKRR